MELLRKIKNKIKNILKKIKKKIKNIIKKIKKKIKNVIKKIKKKKNGFLKKPKKSIAKWKKAKAEGGFSAMFWIMWADFTYAVYDGRKIKRLKKFPPKLVTNRILFETNDDFTDNSRALFDYMVANGYNEKYELVWLVHEPKKYKKFVTKNVKFVRNFKKGSKIRCAKAYRYALTSKYIFYTQAFNWIGMTRKNQVFVNLWHGCGYKANKNGRKVFFDYCLIPGEAFIKTKMEFFGCTSKKLLLMGYPRYDMMLRGSEKAKAFSEKLLKEADSEKLILWMPTYRHASSERLNEETLNNEFNIPIIDDSEKLLELNEYCKQNKILIVIKKHYLQIPYDFGENVLTNIVYLENDDLAENDVQLYEFIHYSDALISDYSSVAIDYLLLDKQLGFTLDDYEAYTESRGWVFENPLEYMPGKHIYSMQEFKDFVADIRDDKDIYAEKRAAVREKTHNVCDNYCQRVLDYFNI